MNYKIRTYKAFDRQFKKLSKRYKSLVEDVRQLAADLQENPYQGADLGGGVHKVRMTIASKGKGKSGGARVITVILDYSEEEAEIGLHYIYDKTDRETLTDAELQAILRQNGL